MPRPPVQLSTTIGALHMTALIFGLYDSIVERLRGVGEYLPRLVMRLVMGWEFFEAGLENPSSAVRSLFSPHPEYRQVVKSMTSAREAPCF
jgi:hypothetical protein